MNVIEGKAEEVHLYRHHHLVCGLVIFKTKDSEQPNMIPLNAVHRTAGGNLPVPELGKIQQALQLQFFNRMQDPTLVVVDVVIQSISNLGFMTDAQFSAPPPGMQVQEIQLPAGEHVQ